MPLSKKEVATLLGMVAGTETDTMDCDGCFQHMAEFAELELAGREIPDALKAIQRHLEQCPCCKDEFSALVVGLNALGGSNSQ